MKSKSTWIAKYIHFRIVKNKYLINEKLEIYRIKDRNIFGAFHKWENFMI